MNEDSPWKPPTTGETPEPAAPHLPPASTPAPEIPAPDMAAPGPQPATPASAGEADRAALDVDPEASPRRGRSRWLVGGAVAAVAALGLAGLFAVNRFSDASTGGSSTAEQLGLDLMSAVESEDVLGMIDTMLPGERDALGDPFVEFVSELQRLEVLSSDTDLSSLAGLDIEFDDESVRVRSTNVSDIVNVRMSADALVTLDGAALPIGALIEDQLPDEALIELRNTQLADSEPFDLELTAVYEGDRWYFSLFHTLAESMRRDADLPSIPTTGVPLLGADTPEGAVDGLLDQLEQLDLAGLIGSLDPFEAQALQRYAPLFVGDAQAMLDDVPLSWRVDVRDFRIEGDGTERTVFVDAIGVSGDLEGEPFSVRFEGDCVRAQFGGEVIDECFSAEADVAELFGGSPAIDGFLDAVRDAFADMEPAGLELRQRDGLWFTSPLATGTEALLAALRALDRSEIDLLVERGEGAATEFVDLLGGGFGLGPAFGDSVVVPGGSFDDLADGTVPSAVEAWERCYAAPDAESATACFAEAIAAGEISEFEVPVALRFPECGLAEATWAGSLYSYDDAAFVATVEPAVACFAGLLDAGAIEWWEVPYEVANFECFEGRNWFNVFDDEEYDARVEDCTAELSRSTG